MGRKDIPVCWSAAGRGTKVEMGWSLLDIWVQLSNGCQCGGADAEPRHVWIQADDLDAQGIIIPVCLQVNIGSYHP
jgi:hypothetical protein